MVKRASALFECPACAGALRLQDGVLACGNSHRYPEIDGVFELLPVDASPPADLFATPYGWLYDNGVKYRPLARLLGRVAWGSDLGQMYSLMDAGVRCEPGQVVLDVPAGGGPALKTAAGRMRGTYVGLDLSRPMLLRAAQVRTEERLAGVMLARADATALPLRDASVDRALCFNSLHLIADKGAVLAELRRVLKRGGELLGTALATGAGSGSLPRPWMEAPVHFFHPADAEALRDAAREAGFRSWTQSQQGSLLVFRGRPGPGASR